MIKFFSEISAKDTLSCGGKGASLGEMTQAGFPVPNWFVLTTEAFWKEKELWSNEVLKAFELLDSPFVAVRSSGTKEDGDVDSFAGQFESYLFVRREDLIQKILQCHKSVSSPRIQSYCESKGIAHDEIKVAVVIQKMVDSEVAGVCFTVNPVSHQEDEIMIEAGYGLGEAVVSGMITPDNYIISKQTWELKKALSQQEKKLILAPEPWGTQEVVIEDALQGQQKLNDEQIWILAQLAEQVESHYGKPMDIEWALEKGKLYLLQARPITSFQVSGENNKKEGDIDAWNIVDEKFFENILNQAYLLTSRVSPVQRDFIGGVNFLNNPFCCMDFLLSIPEPWTTNTCFFLPEQAFQKYCKKASEEFLTPGFFHVYVEREKLWYQKFYDIYHKVLHHFDQNNLINSPALVSDLKSLFDYSSDMNTYYHFLLTIWAFEQEALPCLEKELLEHFKDDFKRIQMCVTAQTELTNEQKFRIELATLKQQYGDSLPKESLEILWKKWRYLWMYSPTDAGYTHKKILELYQGIIIDKTLSIVEEINKNKSDFLFLLNEHKNEKRICEIMQLINYNIFFRTIRMEKIMECYTCLSPVYTNLMEQLSYSREEVGNLLPTEILAFFEKGQIPPKRPLHPGVLFRIDKIKVLTKYELDFIQKKLFLKNTVDEFVWMVAYQGSVVGKVKIIHSEKDVGKVEEGDILVSRFTRPEYIPAMEKASGFITNDGGITCHAAIIARELKKPCIIWTKIATQVLKDGDIIELDAFNGVVRIIES